MNPKYDEAQKLIAEDKLIPAKEILVDLCKADPDNAVLNYQCACIHDRLGLEEDARPYYENAIRLGLTGIDLQNAYVGLGSTLRLLGDYTKSLDVLLEGSKAFPDALVLKVFEAMTLHENGRHNLAVALLLHCLIEKPGDPSIAAYTRAIQQYSQEYGRMPAV